MTHALGYDVIVLGAGASGMMCAATAGYRGKRVLVLDHAPKAGAKIRISGGGKCNFTNRQVSAVNFHGQNPHFVKSALARYPSSAFVELVERHEIAYEERDHGQLFTLQGAGSIISMLRTECDWAGVAFRLSCQVLSVDWLSDHYVVHTSQGVFRASALVVATGGLSFPKLKASPLGYRLATQFGLSVVTTRPGLVGLRMGLPDWQSLAGMSLPASLRCRDYCWTRDLLFTHTGISGPGVLLVSNVWQLGENIAVNLLPDVSVSTTVIELKRQNKSLHAWLRHQLPKKLADYYWQWHPLDGRLAEVSDESLLAWARAFEQWSLWPTGTEGYDKAEVTVGGVDTQAISSKTMEVLHQPGLYFIGEVLDVTGDLGGYNFQWAWASGVACGQSV